MFEFSNIKREKNYTNWIIYKFLIKSSHLNKSPYFEQSLLYLSSLSEMTDRKKRTDVWQRVLQLTPSHVTSGNFSAHMLCMQLHYFGEKRDWLQCNKRPSTSSKFDSVTCSLVGILSIPSLGLLFRHIWTVVYVQYERFPRNQRLFFFVHLQVSLSFGLILVTLRTLW